MNIAYIDNDGYVATKQLTVECHITVDGGNDKPLWDSLIENYKKLLIFCDYSNITKATEYELRTPHIHINSANSIFDYYTPMMPVFGSVNECIQQSLSSEMCTTLSQTGNTYSSCYVKVVDSIDGFNMVYVDETGMRIVYGDLTHTFDESKSDTCEVCKRGLLMFEELKTQMRKRIMYNVNSLGAKLSIGGDGTVDTTIDVKNDEDIEKNLYNLLYPVIYDAKIASLKYIRV